MTFFVRRPTASLTTLDTGRYREQATRSARKAGGLDLEAENVDPAGVDRRRDDLHGGHVLARPIALGAVRTRGRRGSRVARVARRAGALVQSRPRSRRRRHGG